MDPDKMDLGSRLANLSLAEIASMLNTKQQEVLLASISVAARFIQQLQAEDQQLQAEELQQHVQEQQDRLQAEEQARLQRADERRSIGLINTTNNTTTTSSQEIDYDDDEDDDDQHVDQSSDISFDDYSCVGQVDHSSTADRQTLLTIREFAEELKHRRKSIRLSQKGAAQSLRAFTSGEQPCTDAIIYHFENLQLEPDRAMQLIPLLRDWLEWAEKHRLNGKQLPMLSAVTKVPRERKRKVVLFNEKAKHYLEDAFLKNNHPDRYQLDVISHDLNIPTRSIRKWFTNRRQRKRFAEKFSTVSELTTHNRLTG